MKLPRFTLRDLFWLVLVAAVTSAWWVDQSRLRGREQDVVRRETRLTNTETVFWNGIAKRQQEEQQFEELLSKLENGELYTICPHCGKQWVKKGDW
jgi:hypothetical protein